MGLLVSLGIFSILILVTMLITVIFVHEGKKQDSSRPILRQLIKKSFYINLESEKGFVLFIVSRFLFLLPLLILRMFSLYLLQDYIGLADPVAGTSNLILIVGICLVIMVFPAGYLTDRIGRKPVIIFSGTISAVGFLIFFLWNTYFAVILGGVLIGLANGAFMSSNWAMATDLVKRDEEAKFLGLTNLATGGASAAAAFAGPLIDFLNRTFSSPTGYRAILLLCILFSLASSALVMLIKGKKN
jgi:MFS family permease